MDPFLQKITERRQAANLRIKEAQEELAKLDQLEALARQLFPAGAAYSPTAVAGRVTKRDAILSTVELILSDGRRRTSRELLPELKARGVEIGGQDEVNNLAAYLSPEKDRFDSDRQKGGWGLIRHPKKASPRDASTSQ